VNRRIILILVGIIALGFLALYAIQRGPALFLKPPPQERIAFVSDRGGNTDIWTMRADGSDKRRVTDDSADDARPAWSPDARELLSISDRSGRIYQVFVSAWDGRYTHPLTISEGTKDMPIWSGDGREITFISGGKVYGIRRNGGREEQYLPPPQAAAIPMLAKLSYVYAAWSPDSGSLLYVQETDLGLEAYAAEREEIQSWEDEEVRHVGITTARNLEVVWAPSGSRIAVAFINRKGENGLLVGDPGTLEVRNLFMSKGDSSGAARPAWSPDGKRIAFEMWAVQDGTPERCLGIYAVNASGGDPELLIAGDAREPCWSPDGKRIVYTLPREDGRRDIWRANSDGSEAANLTQGEGDNHSPAWSPAVRKKS